jgi:WD40 repeat protein
MNFSTLNIKEFAKHYSTTLSDYVTAIAWSPTGTTLAVTSAAGEVVLWQNDYLATLQTGNGQSVDCIAFSHDGQFLAVGGQDGRVKIWRGSELIRTFEHSSSWVDKLAWSPTRNWLAFGLGSKVQVWDADSQEIVVQLNFDASSVLGFDWRGDGQFLAVGGYRGVKVWNCQDWNDEPYMLNILSASLAIAWSPDGKFLAAGNLDQTLTVIEWNHPEPWVMGGFPGKIRQLTWSEPKTQQGEPLLASCSVDGVVVWEKQVDDSLGWQARVLTNHVDIVNAIAFAPQSFLLASAGADGWICLWQEAEQISQILTDVSTGFSCLAWHPYGNLLAAGSDSGELVIWSKAE